MAFGSVSACSTSSLRRVVGVSAGTTTLQATIDGVTATIEVEVRRLHADHDRVGTIVDGLSDTVPATVQP